MVIDADRAPVPVGSMVTSTVQDAEAARLAGQLFVWANVTVFAPVTVMLEMVTAADADVFFTVIALAALFTPTVSLPNAMLVGETEMLAEAATPLPVSVTFWVPTLSTRVMEAERAPVPVGSMVTSIVQVAEAAKLDGQLLVCAKVTVLAPVTVMLEMVIAADAEVFFTVIAFAALFTPTVSFPKAMLVGETEIVAAAATPLPPSVMV
jgi:hypothetical protein